MVLPFENLSSIPTQDYLADGFTEELITQRRAINANPPSGDDTLQPTAESRQPTTESLLPHN